MIYKFKSKAAGDLIMLEPQGRRLLDIIGKDAGPKGIITAAQLAAAIAALEAAVAQDEAQRQGAAAPDDDAADHDLVRNFHSGSVTGGGGRVGVGGGYQMPGSRRQRS